MNRFARLFIDRPIVAIVLSLVLLISGLLSMSKLPLTEYPNVMPTTMQAAKATPGHGAKLQTRNRRTEPPQQKRRIA